MATQNYQLDDVDFAPVSGQTYAAVVQIYPQACTPQDRCLFAAEIRRRAVEAAPVRVNGIISGTTESTTALARWFFRAEAITGQILAAQL